MFACVMFAAHSLHVCDCNGASLSILSYHLKFVSGCEVEMAADAPDGVAECAICLQNIVTTGGDAVKVLRCGHVFHDYCFGEYQTHSAIVYGPSQQGKCVSCKRTWDEGASLASANEREILNAMHREEISYGTGDLPGPAAGPDDNPTCPSPISSTAETTMYDQDVDQADAAPQTQQFKHMRPGLQLLGMNPTAPCGMCGGRFQIPRMRSMNKANETMKCMKCANKQKLVSKLFKQKLGAWPPAFWGTLTDEQKQKFWATDATGKGDIERQLGNMEKQIEIHKMFQGASGSFQPLSYYKNQGYSQEQLDNIEKNTPPAWIDWNAQLGCNTYKVPIRTEGDMHSQAGVSEETLAGCFGRQKMRNNSDVWEDVKSNVPETCDAKKRRADSSDSDSSSTSDSDNDELDAKQQQKKQEQKAKDKAKKKDQKAKARAMKKQKKDARKNQKQAAKEKQENRKRELEIAAQATQERKAKSDAICAELKARKVNESLAKQMHAKFAALAAPITHMKDDPHYGDLPELCRTKLEKDITEMTTLKRGFAMSMSNSDRFPLPEQCATLKDAATIVDTIKGQLKSASKILKAFGTM